MPKPPALCSATHGLWMRLSNRSPHGLPSESEHVQMAVVVKNRYPERNPGKWRHGLKLRSPGGLSLTHTLFKMGAAGGGGGEREPQ